MHVQIIESERLKVANNKLHEDLTTIENKHRHLSEKNEHLERDLKRANNMLDIQEDANASQNAGEDRSVLIEREMQA
jgi:hypothetical protein